MPWEAVAQGKVGSEIDPLEDDHGYERVGVLESSGSGTQPTDRRVVGLGDPVGQLPLDIDGGLDRGPVVADGAGELDERGQPRA